MLLLKNNIRTRLAKRISHTVFTSEHNMFHEYTVCPKKYAHGFCSAVLCCGYTLTDFPISIRLTSLALWQSNDCPSASKVTLINMDKYFMWIHYERLHNHNKAKHNKTVCIFLGIYCTFSHTFLWIHSYSIIARLVLETFGRGLARKAMWSHPDSKVHGANMGPTWVLRSQIGPMLAPWTLLSGHSMSSLENVSWWRHQMETFSALLAICVGNSPVPGEFPTQRPVTRSFDVYFDLRPNKRLSKESWGWWFETLSCSLWRHRNVHMDRYGIFFPTARRNQYSAAPA